jgi:hypothetical protein
LSSSSPAFVPGTQKLVARQRNPIPIVDPKEAESNKNDKESSTSISSDTNNKNVQ